MHSNFLARIPLFSDFQLDELDHLLSRLDIVNLKAGEVLFHEGDPSENMYVVVSGVIEILVGLDKENELILNLLREGAYLGQMSLIVSDARRTASVRARGDAVLLSMSREKFIELLRRNPLHAYAMIKVISTEADKSSKATYRELTDKSRQLQQILLDK
jgi:CRP-like cAMP-binding protein